MNRILASITLLIFILPACDDGIKPLKLSDVKLKRLASCDELAQALTVSRTDNAPDILYGGDFAAIGEASYEPGSSDTVLGETNLQVSGVDELDYAKADGDFIYRLKAGGYFVWGGGIGGEISVAYPEMPCEGCGSDPAQIIVLRRTPTGEAGVLHTYDLPEQLWNGGIYITESKLLAIGNDGNQTIVHLYDRDPDGSLSFLSTREFDGYLEGSRMIGDKVHLITSKWLEPQYDDEEPMPVEDELPRTRLDEIESDLVGCTDILVEPAALTNDVASTDGGDVVTYPYVINNLLCAISIDIANFSNDPAGECVAGNGWGTVIYASPSNLFLASSAWNTDTPIHQFSLADDDSPTTYIGTALVHGDLLNQFSMDEHEGHLRVASTTWDFIEPEETNEVRIFELGDGDPEETGAIEGLAPGEKIYAVRFLEDKGFVVTFEQVDPLFALDLSDPANPIVRGELIIPGFSTYLHPMEEGYLLSLGKEGSNLIISIFDVRNLDSPALLHRLTVSAEYGADSEALYDHKAFRFISEEGLLVLPVSIFTADDYDSGFRIYNADIIEGLSLAGTYAFPEDTAWSYTAAGRSFYNEGLISLLGGGKLVVRSAAGPATNLAEVDAE